MRELLKAAETVVTKYAGSGTADFMECVIVLEEAIAAAKERSKWVKFSDALPIVPEGKFSTHIWCWRDGQKGKPYPSNFWAVGFKLSESAATHWQYRQDDTPAPPEAE